MWRANPERASTARVGLARFLTTMTYKTINQLGELP